MLFIGIVLFELIALSVTQRVAPGVPPSQYVRKIHPFNINIYNFMEIYERVVVNA